MSRSLLFRLAAILYIAAAVRASTTLAVCNADSCLRAVRASSFTTVHGTAACSSYFLTTVIPATVTITATSTVPQTASPILDVTFTSTVYATATDVSSLTATDVILATASTTVETTPTVTVDSTATSDIDVTATNTIYTTIVDITDTDFTSVVDVTTTHTNLATTTDLATTFITLLDRRTATIGPTTITPSSIPIYASACSGSVRYSSACSCVGVTPSTVTVPAPSTTITIPYSPIVATITQTITVSTATSISTQSTDTIFTTASTETDYTTITTTTAIITDVAVTVTTTISTETDFITLATSTLVVAATTSTLVSTTGTVTSLFTDTTLQATVTATKTIDIASVTVTPTCQYPYPTFAIQVQNGPTPGQYLYSSPYVNGDLAVTGTSITARSVYTLSGTTLFEYNYNIFGIGNGGGFALFQTLGELVTSKDNIPACTIGSNDELTCSAPNGFNIFALCYESGWILTLLDAYGLSVLSAPGAGCSSAISLKVVPLCIVP